ncbi:MAG: hypothetical protein ACSLFM_06660 [Tepidiformaceae bacterium]
MRVNGSASDVTGERLSGLEGSQVFVDRSAIRAVHAEQAQVERSAVGFASFEQGTIKQSSAGVVVARSVACDEVRTFVLASPVVRGEVHTFIDLRTAIAIGFGMALGKAFLSLVRLAARRAF